MPSSYLVFLPLRQPALVRVGAAGGQRGLRLALMGSDRHAAGGLTTAICGVRTGGELPRASPGC